MKLLTTLLLCFLLHSATAQTDSLFKNANAGVGIVSISQTDGHGHLLAERESCDTCKWKVLDAEGLMKYYEDQLDAEQAKFLKLAAVYNTMAKDYNKLRKMFIDHLAEDKVNLEKFNATVKPLLKPKK